MDECVLAARLLALQSRLTAPVAGRDDNYSLVQDVLELGEALEARLAADSLGTQLQRCMPLCPPPLMGALLT
jgi:hypothetical protein